MRGPPGYSWGDKRRGTDVLFLLQREGSRVGGQDFVASEKPQQHPVVEENLSDGEGTGQ